MRTFLLKLTLSSLTCIFYSTVYGQNSCSEVFTSERQPRTSGTLRLAQTPVREAQPQVRRNPVANPTESHVSRDQNLLRALIRNKRFHALTQQRNDRGVQSWFLSLSENGRLYRMVIIKDRLGQVVDMFADAPTPRVESFYYNRVAELLSLEPLVAEINLPQKGRRNLTVAPEVLIKLDVKHDIRAEELLQYLRRVPRGVRYRPNNSVHYEGRDSFIFFLDVGRERPLEIVMLHENNTYRLLTAFIPEVFIDR